MQHRIRCLTAGGALALIALAACDDDPSRPVTVFQRNACPTAALNVNQPITLTFTAPISPTTVTGANIVVANALTGVELPGAVSLTTPTTITFTPFDPLPFATQLRIRVQNLLTDTTNVPLQGVQVCEVLTQNPPITQLFWDRLPSATGTQLTGVSIVDPDTGFVSSDPGTIFRRRAGDFEVIFNEPYYSAANDIAFLSADTGYSIHFNTRVNRRYVLRTLDGGTTWDTVYSTASIPTRLWMRRMGTGVFGVMSGGGSTTARFWKFTGTTFADAGTFGTTSNAHDVDFAWNDTLKGAAASGGSRFTSLTYYGKVYVSTNGGTSWAEVPGAQADTQALGYQGVSVRQNGDVWVVGGSGRVLRLTPSGAWGSTFTITRVNIVGAPPNESLVNPDSLDPEALIFMDVEFAPDDDQRGWIVGALRIGVVNGVPQYQGLIFETRDGGTTWTRQGVRGAEDFGASFPRVNRISVLNSSNVWIVGEAGFAIAYQP